MHKGVCASQYHKSVSFIFFLSLLEMCVSFKNASCVCGLGGGREGGLGEV